ncbi:MAG: MauE/DoxX family redox-associated membrane protein [Verrucomicrobiales bacterium]
MASDGSIEKQTASLDDVASQSSATRALYWGSIVGSILFGGSWVYAGILKARDPIIFLDDVRSFQILGDPWAAYLALGLPWLEIICGLAVVFRRFYLASLTILSGLLGVFLIAIVSAWHRGLDITCGCFGKSDNKTDYGEIITRDILLLLGSLALIGISVWLGKMATKSVRDAARQA